MQMIRRLSVAPVMYSKIWAIMQCPTRMLVERSPDDEAVKQVTEVAQSTAVAPAADEGDIRSRGQPDAVR